MTISNTRIIIATLATMTVAAFTPPAVAQAVDPDIVADGVLHSVQIDGRRATVTVLNDHDTVVTEDGKVTRLSQIGNALVIETRTAAGVNGEFNYEVQRV